MQFLTTELFLMIVFLPILQPLAIIELLPIKAVLSTSANLEIKVLFIILYSSLWSVESS